MKRYRPLPLALTLSLIVALFAVPTFAQATPSAAATLTKKPNVPALAPRDDAEDEEEFEGDEAEEIEVEDCEAAEGIFEFEEEEFEGEEAEEEEEFEIEVEECEEEAQQKNKKAGAVTAPEECRVQQAESSITALPGSDRVELTVRYLTYKPSTVSLGLKLKDNKGSLKIEDTTKRLSKKGVLHLTTKVSDAVMERAAKAREFSVALRAPKTPGYCGDMLEQQLQAKHPVGNARVFTQRVKS
jgi:hypothetical protein